MGWALITPSLPRDRPPRPPAIIIASDTNPKPSPARPARRGGGGGGGGGAKLGQAFPSPLISWRLSVSLPLLASSQ